MTATSTFSPGSTRPEVIQPSPTRASSRRLWKTGAVAGVTAAVATTAVAAIGHAADVSLEVSSKAIPVLGFGQLTLVGALLGTILAVVLSRRASRPQRTFVVTTVVLTALSLVPDLTANAASGTRALLALTHLVAAAIVIPALASKLSD
jgi:peptidoglycan/LPS O-acetylase OafA/YrhL